MTALIIIFAILLAVFALLMLRGQITVEYREALCVRVSVLGIPLWRHPKKQKRIRISDYTPEKIARRKKREEKKLAKKQKRKLKKAQKKQTPTKSTQKPTQNGVLDSLQLVRDVLGVALKKTAGHARLQARCIIINVATDDAAKTAILFGAVNQAVIALVEFLDQANKWRRLRSSEIAVKADFAAQKSTVDISVTLSFRVWQLINILFHTALRYVKVKASAKSKEKITEK